DKLKPSAASASSKTCREAGNVSAKSFPMPAYCEPWPGKINAIGPIFPMALIRPIRISLPAHNDSAPGHAAAERSHQNYITRLDATGFDTFIKPDRYRCR